MQVKHRQLGAARRCFSFLLLGLAWTLGQATPARAADSCLNSVGENAPTLDQSSARALAPVVKTLLTYRLDDASITPEEKAPLLAALDHAVTDYLATSGGGTGGAGNGGSGGNGGNNGGGGDEPPPRPDGVNPINPDPQALKDLEAHVPRVTFQRCAGETAILLSVSTVVTAIGAVIVHWQTYRPNEKTTFWQFMKKDIFTWEAWKKAANDPEFTHNLTWNTILMTTVGAMSCMGNKNSGRNVLTAVSLGASALDQWRTGRFSLRQTLVDTLWTRYVSFWKTGKVLQYSRSYAAAGRPNAKLLEASLQTLSEMVGAFGYPLTNKASQYVWDRGAQIFAAGGN